MINRLNRLTVYLLSIIVSCKLSFAQTPNEIRTYVETGKTYLYEREFNSINEKLKDWYLCESQQNHATLIATALAYQDLINACFFCAESQTLNSKQELLRQLNTWNTLQSLCEFPVKIFLSPASAVFPRAKGYWHVLMAKEKVRNEIKTSFFAKIQNNIPKQIQEFLDSNTYRESEDKNKYNLLAAVSKHYSLLNLSEFFRNNFKILVTPYLEYFFNLDEQSLDYLGNEFRLKLIELERQEQTRIIYSFLIAEWSQTPS